MQTQAAVALSRSEPKTAPGRDFVSVKSNADLENERLSKAELDKAQAQPIIIGLAGKIKSDWEQARFARNEIEERIIDSLRRRNGEYSPQKLAQIKAQGGAEIFMMLTQIKCRAAEAWINDVLFPAGDKPWKVDHTPIPEINPDIEKGLAEAVSIEAQQWMQEYGVQLPEHAVQERFQEVKEKLKEKIEQEAVNLASKMELKIEDQFAEGNWKEAMLEVIKDTVTFPAGILKGPNIRKRKSLKWVQINGSWVQKIGTEYRPEYYRVAPFDLYPSPSSKNVNDGYLIERHRLRRTDLVAMKGVPGYNDTAIDQVLSDYGVGGLREWLWRDQERAHLEGRPNEFLFQGDTIDALEYWGSASGKMLIEWGMDASKVEDVNKEYQINAWLIGNHVIRARLNDDPLGGRPYDKCSFEEIPGSFWGKGVPELMADVQDVCNAAARSLVNNMAIASGPQVEVHTDRVPLGEDITSIRPWKIWQTLSDPHGTNNPAVRFHNPKTNVQALMAVYEKFSGLADEYTGIPKYAYGESGGSGAAGTASGLSMLMSSAARGIKEVISHIDGPIEGSVKRTYYFNMIHGEDESIKGDLKCIAKGSSSLVAKEQKAIRTTELLNATNNPVDMQIIGNEGRAVLLRESLKTLDIPVDDVVPDKDKLMQKMQQAMAVEMNAAQGGQTLDAAGNPVSGQDTALFQGAAA